mmetsp:Transcript_18961/g.52892  ORF Transcript_18961/g.52892 Transcript_18961/m.52892 type:complete len:235 (+) Transcript_18961:78-782(+)
MYMCRIEPHSQGAGSRVGAITWPAAAQRAGSVSEKRDIRVQLVLLVHGARVVDEGRECRVVLADARGYPVELVRQLVKALHVEHPVPVVARQGEQLIHLDVAHPNGEYDGSLPAHPGGDVADIVVGVAVRQDDQDPAGVAARGAVLLLHVLQCLPEIGLPPEIRVPLHEGVERGVLVRAREVSEAKDRLRAVAEPGQADPGLLSSDGELVDGLGREVAHRPPVLPPHRGVLLRR